LQYYLASWVDITERKQAEEALRRSEYKYRSAIESARDGILLVDNNNVILDANRTCVHAVGFDYKEQLIGRSVFDIVAGEAPEEIQGRVGDMLEKQGYITNVEVTARSRDGREIPVEVNISQVVDEKGRPTGSIIVIRDITERKRAADEIMLYTKRLEALHAISVAVSQTLDLDELLNSALEKVLEVIAVEAGYIHLFDREKAELLLKAHRGVSEQHVAAVERLEVSEEAMQRWHKYPEPAFNTRQVLTEGARQGMAPAVRQDSVATSVSVPLWSKSVMHGGLTLISRTHRRFSPEELDLLKAIGNEIAVGIESAKLLERTKELSATDELTGLYNRRQFYDVLENEMNRMQRYGGCFTLAMLDLDDFKEYNDRFGHTNGDAVLRSLAEMLKTVLRKPDMAFRYGGDEFAIILPATEAQKAKNIVDRIRSKRLVGLKSENEDMEPCLGFSAGIAQFPENAETADGLVFLADTALYRSKRGGGNKTTLVAELGELPADIIDSATMDQVYALAATVDARDPHTYGHSKRVAAISEMIGKAIGLQPKELADLRAAALLHDIGKVGVPDSILTKPEKPEEHEWAIIRKHPVEGAKIVGYVRELERLVPLVRHHHEWYDGTGYPDGLKGEDIPLGARIISVADAYDTMTTSRPYRDMISQEEACEELRRCCGTQFDHEIVDAFHRALNEATVPAAAQGSSHL
jgi:diguanylate cyclase (GGDEF)-like protein/PAS domain S-box-containing protein/putative nucleotidyltransferase with HDIG domain